MSVDWERVARASLHPTRVGILDCFQGKPLSPVMIAERIGEPLGNVSYHVRALAKDGLIEEVDRQPRRGAVEHYYQLTTVKGRRRRR